MNRSHLRRVAAAVLGVSCVAAVAATAAFGAHSGNGNTRQVLNGTKPAWTAAVAQTAGVAASASQSAKVWLAPRNAAQLATLARAVSDPASSQYKQFLSHAQYASQYAPTTAQVSAVTSWLTGAGLKVTSVGPDNHYVAVTGRASAIASAFGASLGLYTVNGVAQQAPTANLSVPSSVASSVLGITGLTKLGHTVTPHDLGAPSGFVNGTPCSSYYGQKVAGDLPKFEHKTIPYAVCGYTPSQLRGAYGITASHLNGAGQTVAITDAFDASTLAQDANTYSTLHGDTPFAPGQFTDHSFPEGASSDPDPIEACGGNGWYGEQALDVEAVHGIAQAANVAYYGAASCYDDDLLAALSKVTQDDTASLVTNSWGEPTFLVIDGTLYATIDETLVADYESVFQQGAVEGIGFYFSSGDNGDENDAYGYAHPDWPTGDPWVTSVGGTSLAVGSDNTRQFETGWGTSKYSLSADGSSWFQSIPFQYGAGGGFSEIFAQPWYQNGVINHNPTGGRGVPDIGMDADPTTGMLVGETQTFDLSSRYGPAGVHYGEYRIGGTSLASPLFAAVQAVVQQRAGGRIGFANPLIYALKGTSNGRSVYFDPKSHTPEGGNVRADYRNGYNADDGYLFSVRTFNQDSSLATQKGWDDVTGVGTPSGDYIAAASGH